jgi:hypothetical protein
VGSHTLRFDLTSEITDDRVLRRLGLTHAPERSEGKATSLSGSPRGISSVLDRNSIEIVFRPKPK